MTGTKDSERDRLSAVTVARASDRVPVREAFDLLYHVPRSQVWQGSRGGQSGNIHLHVKAGEAFQAGRIRRVQFQSLCGRSGWYERPVDPSDTSECPRCFEIGVRAEGKLSGLLRYDERNALVPEEISPAPSVPVSSNEPDLSTTGDERDGARPSGGERNV